MAAVGRKAWVYAPTLGLARTILQKSARPASFFQALGRRAKFITRN
jgi:hypothetical protein